MKGWSVIHYDIYKESWCVYGSEKKSRIWNFIFTLSPNNYKKCRKQDKQGVVGEDLGSGLWEEFIFLVLCPFTFF